MALDFTTLEAANSSLAVDTGVADPKTTTAALLAQFMDAAIKTGALYGLAGIAAVMGLVL